MTDDRHDTEATTARKGKRGPIVAGPEARAAAKPAKGAKSAEEPPVKAPQRGRTGRPDAREREEPDTGLVSRAAAAVAGNDLHLRRFPHRCCVARPAVDAERGRL